MNKIRERQRKLYKESLGYEVGLFPNIVFSIILGLVSPIVEALIFFSIFDSSDKLPIVLNNLISEMNNTSYNIFVILLIIFNVVIIYRIISHFSFKSFLNGRLDKKLMLLEVRKSKLKFKISKDIIHLVKFTDLKGKVHNLEISISKRTKYNHIHEDKYVGVSNVIIKSDTIPCELSEYYEFRVRTSDVSLREYISRISEDLSSTLDKICSKNEKKKRFVIEENTCN